jgi:glycosyltransferase involved in cell wall biosynthesis
MPSFGLAGRRTACFVHDLLPLEHPEYWGRAERVVKQAAYAAVSRQRPTVFTSSEHNADRVQARLGPPARVARFGCGALSDAEADEALACGASRESARQARIVFVGALEPRKDVMTLLRAFERVASSFEGVQLVLMGEPRGRMRAAIAGWRRHAPTVARRVQWTGHASREAVIEAMSTAAAVVYPSRAEGFGLPVLEALALGTPVIAADLPAIRSWAYDTCAYAAPGDVEAWANAMRCVLAGERPEAARGHALSRTYRWRAFAATMIDGW